MISISVFVCKHITSMHYLPLTQGTTNVGICIEFIIVSVLNIKVTSSFEVHPNAAA